MAAFAAGSTSSRRWRSARAVLIGRPHLWGVAGAGEDGVFWVLDLFRREIDRALALGG
jgi:isopentenyl diphosphate isomerase/L-lactate dehydrogenase-like FMN-dependent dehydrogenase